MGRERGPAAVPAGTRKRIVVPEMPLDVTWDILGPQMTGRIGELTRDLMAANTSNSLLRSRIAVLEQAIADANAADSHELEETGSENGHVHEE